MCGPTSGGQGPMPRNKFVLNRAGLSTLANGSQSGQAMERIAREIAQRAEANGGRFTQGYTSMRVPVERTAGARAGTDYPFAHWDEWGSAHRTPRAPLRRALSSMNLLNNTKRKPKP